MINNTALIVGTIISEPQYDHTVMNEKFHLFYVSSVRKSGVPDVLPVIISERLIDTNVTMDMRVEIKGSFRSYNLYKDGARHKLLFLFVESTGLTDQSEDENEISLDGYLCKQAIYRETPLGRQVTDVILAVNRLCRKTDYLPVIMWSRNAVVVSKLEVGANIKLKGRMQSRWYQKRLEDGSIEERCCYEISAYWMDELCSGGFEGENKGRESDQILQ